LIGYWCSSKVSTRASISLGRARHDQNKLQ